ncbi:MAG: sodium:solute symporter family protein [Candidatus Hydrogenedentes bacterium]|nr:sodium:solute symporter family protein [Candidatus Hydrogenedentota bacterium]
MSQQLIGTPLDALVMLVYFFAVVGFGLLFGKYATTTKDFYLGGQRFAWWLIAFSGIATTVGSYSFVKYSEAGYKYGIGSSQSYLNDWFWVPILLFVWLPIIYFNRLVSVPEYFNRRFGPVARQAAVVFTMLYLISYVGVNLLTLGTALHTLLGWSTFSGACLAGLTVTFYVLAGGQTSVIMTDLVQGLTLMLVGLGLFVAGVIHFGGFTEFWGLLPQDHRQIFSEFANPPKFSFIGIYAQDGIANTAAFVLMNQGMIMRFLALRSVQDARKMALFWILILYPLAAITVSGGGWIAKALENNGELTFGEAHGAADAFILASDFLCQPGIFGLVLAALMAALMSSADTLINAVSAIFVNDIYQPLIRKNAPDKHYLRVARISSLMVAVVGLALVPLYDQFSTIYEAHAFITAAIPPPVVVAILLGLFWRRYNGPAAVATIAGGGLLTGLSMIAPFSGWFIGPLSFGMGPDSYTYMRALFSILASLACGIPVALLTKPQPLEQLNGLVNGTQLNAMWSFKGSAPNRKPGKAYYSTAITAEELQDDEAIVVNEAMCAAMNAEQGDLVYVCDRRWWLGGLRSVHGRIVSVRPDGPIRLSPGAMARAHFSEGDAVYVEKHL